MRATTDSIRAMADYGGSFQVAAFPAEHANLPSRTAGGSRPTLWWARIVCLSAFGPYVTGSARTEQIVVFVSFAAILTFGWPQVARARHFAPVPFLVLWGGLYAVMLIATVRRPLDPAFYGAQPISHALSALLLPLALVTVTWFWTLSADGADLIAAVAPVIVAAMIVNTAISLAQVATRNVAIVSFLPRFWDSSGSTGSVAVVAAGNGRFTGIFDQPAEAGIAYGVALFCLIWLTRRRAVNPVVITVCAVMLITGGAVTLSKVFLLGGVPIAVLTILRGRSRVRVAAWGALAGAGLWLAAGAGILPAWSGLTAIRGYAQPAGSLTAQYSAGRYGAGGSLGPVVSDVMRASPLSGFGAGALSVAYDSLWIEVLVVSGILGLIFAAATVALLAFRWVGLRPSLEPPEWHLAGGTLALAIGSSLGIPSLTANRAATLLWLVIGVLIAARPAVSRSEDVRVSMDDGHILLSTRATK
jgi:hypothetical protein